MTQRRTSNAGGGGERVLWTAIALLQRTQLDVINVVYSGDTDATKEEIISKVQVCLSRAPKVYHTHIGVTQARFAIELSPSTLHFVFLNSRYLVEDSTWPRFTILGQSIGSMFLAWEAMSKLAPDLFIGSVLHVCLFSAVVSSCVADTMGYAFSFHVVTLLGRIPVGAYVHYPTLSTDMLERVKSRKQWHTNSDVISSSSILSRGKLL